MVFRLRLSRIKCSQAMSMVKFSPTALNLDYDFVLIFWNTLYLQHPQIKKDGKKRRKKYAT